MSTRRFLALAVGLSLLFVAPAAWAGEDAGVVQKIRQLESRPVLSELPAQYVSGQERVTAFLYEDRIEYYDTQLLDELSQLVGLPATASNGVLFTEVFFTQFRQHPGLYLVQRGWDKEGNCQVLTSRIRVESESPLVRKGGGFETVSLDDGDSCSGDPCRKCKPFDPDLGCICELGEKCNHTVTVD